MALAKLPADRFGTAAEFSAALVNPGFTLPGTIAFGTIGDGDTRWKRRAQLAFGLAALLAATSLYGFLRPAKIPPAPVTRVGLGFPPGEGLRQGPFGRVAISPDGARLAYVANTGAGGGAQLMVRERDQLHATVLPGAAGGVSPFFSPDGKSLAYFSGIAAPNPLRIVSLTGAPPITVADTGLVPMGGDWGSDGYLYVSGARAWFGFRRLGERWSRHARGSGEGRVEPRLAPTPPRREGRDLHGSTRRRRPARDRHARSRKQVGHDTARDVRPVCPDGAPDLHQGRRCTAGPAVRCREPQGHRAARRTDRGDRDPDLRHRGRGVLPDRHADL